jgi:hypothetical protein
LIILRVHLTTVRIAIIKKTNNNKCRGRCREKNPICSVLGNVSWLTHYGNQYGDSLKNLKIELSHDPAMPLLGIYPKECKTAHNRDSYTSMFIVVQLTIAKLWDQPRCISTDEYIYIHIHTYIYI